MCPNSKKRRYSITDGNRGHNNKTSKRGISFILFPVSLLKMFRYFLCQIQVGYILTSRTRSEVSLHIFFIPRISSMGWWSVAPNCPLCLLSFYKYFYYKFIFDQENSNKIKTSRDIFIVGVSIFFLSIET